MDAIAGWPDVLEFGVAGAALEEAYERSDECSVGELPDVAALSLPLRVRARPRGGCGCCGWPA